MIKEASQAKEGIMNFPRGMTVAIVNWNHEMLLPRSIGSALKALAVLRKMGIPGEVIVLDYCSRDGSVNLLRKLETMYYREGLRVWAYAKNDSLATGRNQAILQAKYRYLCFLDSDNELVPENLPLFLKTLEDTGAAVAYGNLLVREGTSRSAIKVLNNESVQTRLFGYNYIDAFVTLDRVHLIDSGFYDTSNTLLEDYECWLHLITNGRSLAFVPAVLGYYYINKESMARTDLDRATAIFRRYNRIFNQFKAREQMRHNSEHLRYHPVVGYV
jgi:glycosyltransferase involved in cell wall biosynthesis